MEKGQSWTMDMFTVTAPGRGLHWDDLTGDMLGSDEVEKARKLVMDFIRNMGVSEKVPLRQAQEGGPRAIGVRWVDVREADGKDQ